MKKYRVVFWLCLHRAEYIVKADNKEEARQKFIEQMGEREIIQIYETFLSEHN